MICVLSAANSPARRPKSVVSIVHPGVFAFGKKKITRFFWPRNSLRSSVRPSCVGPENAGNGSPTRTAMVFQTSRDRWGARTIWVRLPNRVYGLAPDSVGYLDEALQLGPLRLGGDQVARQGGGEPALRAQRQPLQRDVLRRLLHPALEQLGALQLGLLGRDQPEHHHLVLGHEAQRREGAGARRVVLQQQALGLDGSEQLLGDRVVAALDRPHA